MGLGPYLKETSDLLIRAVVCALLLSSFVVAPFRIPTPSMEPTLLGDADEAHLRACPYAEYHRESLGDRVLVSRFSYGLTGVKRFDVLVFRYPLDISKSFIKRAVGLPGEDLIIDQGEIFTRSSARDPFRIVRKPLSIQEDIWIRVGGPYGDSDQLKKDWSCYGELQVGADALDLLPSGDTRIAFNHFIQDGDRRDNRHVPDVRLSMDLELAGAGEFHARLVNGRGQFTAKLSASSPGELVVQARGGGERIVRLQGPPFDRSRHLEMMFLDGECIVRIDGRVAGSYAALETHEDLRQEYFTGYLEEFGTRKLSAHIRSLRVDRDLYFKRRDGDENIREGEFLSIPAGAYFMLGDNAAVSKDARCWMKRTYSLKDGRRIVCDRDAADSGTSKYPYRDSRGHPAVVVVRADEYGSEIPIFEDEIDDETRDRQDDRYSFVAERYIVGKALWIWWPRDRWFRGIR